MCYEFKISVNNSLNQSVRVNQSDIGAYIYERLLTIPQLSHVPCRMSCVICHIYIFLYSDQGVELVSNRCVINGATIYSSQSQVLPIYYSKSRFKLAIISLLKETAMGMAELNSCVTTIFQNTYTDYNNVYFIIQVLMFHQSEKSL